MVCAVVLPKLPIENCRESRDSVWNITFFAGSQIGHDG
jgi:hypothetical protein